MLEEDAETNEIGILLDPDENGIEKFYMCAEEAAKSEDEDACFQSQRIWWKKKSQIERKTPRKKKCSLEDAEDAKRKDMIVDVEDPTICEVSECKLQILQRLPQHR